MRKVSLSLMATLALVITSARADVVGDFAIMMGQGENIQKVIETVIHYSSRCGSIQIEVQGVTEVKSGFFRQRERLGDILLIKDSSSREYASNGVRKTKKELSLKKCLSDWNGVSCINSERLLIWKRCSGNRCGDWSFIVVDLKSFMVISSHAQDIVDVYLPYFLEDVEKYSTLALAPIRSNPDECDSQCASVLLNGSKFPMFLEYQWNQ